MRDAIEQRTLFWCFSTVVRITFFTARAALFGLDPLPVSQHLGGIFCARLPENMRMPPDHLVVDFANHLGYGEAAFFARDLRMENNLQKKIAHLFREFGIVPAFEGFQNFVGFFDQVGSQRLMRLLAVPGASVQGAQSGLHGHELFKPLAWRQLLRFRRFAAAAAQFFFFFRLLLARRHVLFNYFNFEPGVPLYGSTLPLTSIADLKCTRRTQPTCEPVLN